MVGVAVATAAAGAGGIGCAVVRFCNRVLPSAAAGITFWRMTTVSLKLPEVLLREVEHEAATRGVGKSAIIRDCIERTLRKKKKPGREVSCLELMGDLVGSFRGPRDLSTNRRYLIEALAANARRRPKNGR
jgi:hypothetical protein